MPSALRRSTGRRMSMGSLSNVQSLFLAAEDRYCVIQLLGLDKDNECNLSGKITRGKSCVTEQRAREKPGILASLVFNSF